MIVCGVLCVMWQNSSLRFFDSGIVCPGFSSIILFWRSIFSSWQIVLSICAENGVQIIGALYFAARCGTAPMWSRWACVIIIAITSSLQSFIFVSCGTASALFRLASVSFLNSPISSSVSFM